MVPTPRSKQRKTKAPSAHDASSSSPSSPSYVVGIGASAGGLEALRALFAGLKEAKQLSFVVVQHLAPQHRSRLVELIAHETTLEVREIKEGDAPQAGVIYVTPPNADAVIEEGRLHLRSPAIKIGPKPSVDLFLASLAQDLGDHAIGIVLSGTGSDGAHGIRAIKAAGGLTLCQSPESAKYDGMPRAALQTGAVDRVLTTESMAAELLRIDRNKVGGLGAAAQEGQLHESADPYGRILALLDRHTGIDLSDYKQSTVRRRIERRLLATGLESLGEYAEFLGRTPAEAKLLFADILISVTSFFRDTEAFDALAEELNARIAAAHSGSQFRCWIAGCATGEEVFSIAILIREAMRRADKRLRVQIFATDLDEQALLIARKATYSKASLVNLPQELAEKYFQPSEDRLQVSPEIREMVVFAKHDLSSDPPFLGLDLIACRNVLIYFNGSLQERVLRVFHYSLHPGGLLFLGRSETASHPAGCFDQLDKQSKLYARVRSGTGLQPPQMRIRREAQREAALASRDREESQGADAFHAMINAVAPSSVLIDDEGRIRQVFGSAGDYLRLPPGEATTAITKLVPAGMSTELSTLLHRARKHGRALRGQRHELTLAHKGRIQLQQQVIPINIGSQREFLVGFEQFELSERQSALTAESEALSKASSAEDRIKHLEMELKSARESLQLTVEEHETANEELQALNEELQSTNEELQSANEEMETTNEELQSTNEELTTLNQELNVKSGELQLVNQRLAAIQSAIFYPLLIVDRALRLQNFNPAARYLFRITDGDLGSNIRAIPAYLDIQHVSGMLEEAFIQEKDQSLEFEVQGRHFEVKLQLFRDGKNTVAGAVVSFVEMTELRAALQDAQLKQRQIAAITENTPAVITMKDSQGVYTYANSRFCALVGLSNEEIIGRTDEDLFGEAQGSAIRELDFEVLKSRRASQGEEAMQLHGDTRWWLSARFPLLDSQNRAYSVCTVSQDVSERVRHQQELLLFRQTLSDATDGIVIFSDSEDVGLRADYCSGRLVRDFGIKAEAESGMSLRTGLERVLSDAPDVDRDALERQLHSFGTTAVTYRSGDGAKSAWIDLRLSRLELGESKTRYVVMVLHDVSQQVRNEKALQEQKEALSRFSRLASLGEVAAGISHEINTPLNAISTKTELLRRMVDGGRSDPERTRRLTQDIDRMVDNISQVITGLKSISRSAGRDQRERVLLRKLLEDTLRIVGFSTRRRGVKIHLDLRAEDLQVWCNPVQICQILINLINNALDAVGDQSEAWVRLTVAERDDFIVVDVIDSGGGVQPEVAEKIMTPFFTTKGPEKGTGLGLSLSRSIARRHGGELELCRDMDHTTFRLTLPKRMTEDAEKELA